MVTLGADLDDDWRILGAIQKARENDLLDGHEEEDISGAPGAMNLCWWKTVTFREILTLECMTAGYVTEGDRTRGGRVKGPACGTHSLHPSE